MTRRDHSSGALPRVFSASAAPLDAWLTKRGFRMLHGVVCRSEPGQSHPKSTGKFTSVRAPPSETGPHPPVGDTHYHTAQFPYCGLLNVHTKPDMLTTGRGEGEDNSNPDAPLHFLSTRTRGTSARGAGRRNFTEHNRADSTA